MAAEARVARAGRFRRRASAVKPEPVHAKCRQVGQPLREAVLLPRQYAKSLSVLTPRYSSRAALAATLPVGKATTRPPAVSGGGGRPPERRPRWSSVRCSPDPHPPAPAACAGGPLGTRGTREESRHRRSAARETLGESSTVFTKPPFPPCLRLGSVLALPRLEVLQRIRARSGGAGPGSRSVACGATHLPNRGPGAIRSGAVNRRTGKRSGGLLGHKTAAVGGPASGVLPVTLFCARRCGPQALTLTRQELQATQIDDNVHGAT